MKNEDWLFKLERQIVNNLKKQITDIDVANILEYNRKGKVKDVSYVPLIENNLYFLWNEVDNRVNESTFFSLLDLAEFNKEEDKRKQLEVLIKYYNEQIAETTDKKQKLLAQIERNKLIKELSSLPPKKTKINLDIPDDLEADALRKKLKDKNLSETERKGIEKRLDLYKRDLKRKIQEEPEYEITEKDKEDIKIIQEKKKQDLKNREQKLSKEEIQAIKKVENLDPLVKNKVFNQRFSSSPFMKTRYNQLALNLQNSVDKEDKEKKYKQIIKIVNAEARNNQKVIKEAIEEVVTLDNKKIQKRKEKIISNLTGGLRIEAFKKQVNRLIEKDFSIKGLEKIYRSQLNNSELTKRQREVINGLINKYIENEENVETYTTLIANLKKQQSVENQVERLIVTEMTAAYNIATFLSSDAEYYKWSIEPEHERRNKVCLVCYERANGGYLNKGIYPRKQIEINKELFIPKHPYCLCRYIPIRDEGTLAKLGAMSDDERRGYEASMDNWQNLSNNWGTLGSLAKKTALVGLTMASLWLAAKQFKKVSDLMKKRSGGFVETVQRGTDTQVDPTKYSPQRVIQDLTGEKSRFPDRPQLGMGEVDKVTDDVVESIIADTNQGSKLIVEGIEERGESLPPIIEKIMQDKKLESVSEIPPKIYEALEVIDVVTEYERNTREMSAPLELEMDLGVKENQNYPIEDLSDLPDTVETNLPNKILPTLTDLGEQATGQFVRNHSKEFIEVTEDFNTIIRNALPEDINDLGEVDNYIYSIEELIKKMRNLLLQFPDEIYSSKNKRKEKKISFIVNGKDVGFPFGGKDRIGKARGFAQQLIRGENGNILGKNPLNDLDLREKQLRELLQQLKERKLRLMETEGIYNLQNEKVFYDPVTKQLVPDNVLERLNEEILDVDIFKNLHLIKDIKEIENLENIYLNSLNRALKGNNIENLPIEIKRQLKQIENNILERKEFIQNNPLLKSTDLKFQEFMDIVLETENINILGNKVKNSQDVNLNSFLSEVRLANDFLKMIETLERENFSNTEIKEYLIKNLPSDINIKNSLNLIQNNKQDILNYIGNELIELETKINKLLTLKNSEQIILENRGNISEEKVRDTIDQVLGRLRTRQSYLLNQQQKINNYLELKRNLENREISYLNVKERLENLPVLDKNLQSINRKFRTVQEKINYLKQQISDLIIEKQQQTNKKQIEIIDDKIRVLTEEIRKVQIAEFRRYEIEKNNNYIQYLSVKDNVLFSKIFRDKLLK